MIAQRNPRARGLATVEFALVGATAILLLIACLEIARAFFTWNSLAEATRRAARVAAVCPVNDAKVRGVAMMTASSASTSSRYLHGLASENIQVSYLDSAGGATTNLDAMRFVRVSITGYQYAFAIPLLGGPITAPPFSTTLPVESLGYVPGSSTRACTGL